eukprot:scaffold30788_cov63-Phaeocystis_antarctica.AAC.4
MSLVRTRIFSVYRIVSRGLVLRRSAPRAGSSLSRVPSPGRVASRAASSVSLSALGSRSALVRLVSRRGDNRAGRGGRVPSLYSGVCEGVDRREEHRGHLPSLCTHEVEGRARVPRGQELGRDAVRRQPLVGRRRERQQGAARANDEHLDRRVEQAEHLEAIRREVLETAHMEEQAHLRQQQHGARQDDAVDGEALWRVAFDRLVHKGGGAI